MGDILLWAAVGLMFVIAALIVLTSWPRRFPVDTRPWRSFSSSWDGCRIGLCVALEPVLQAGSSRRAFFEATAVLRWSGRL